MLGPEGFGRDESESRKERTRHQIKETTKFNLSRGAGTRSGLEVTEWEHGTGKNGRLMRIR